MGLNPYDSRFFFFALTGHHFFVRLLGMGCATVCRALEVMRMCHPDTALQKVQPRL